MIKFSHLLGIIRLLNLRLVLLPMTTVNKILYEVASKKRTYADDSALALDKEFALQLQQRLCDFHLLSQPDGKWGEKSSAALTRFKSFRGLKEVGCRFLTAAQLINITPTGLIDGYKLDGSLASRALMFFVDKGFKIAKNLGECNIFYLEGINRDGSLNENNRFVYNDRRCILQFDNINGLLIPKLTGNWLATCDPGEYYWDNPLNENGCANIKKNAQYKAWITGKHHDQYALVQVGEITVLRGEKQIPFSGADFGVNQHSVGKGQDFSFGEAIGRWSAGCSVGASRVEHEAFMRRVDADPREKAAQGSYLHYTAFIKGVSLEAAFPYV
jgi:hypothetical protein